MDRVPCVPRNMSRRAVVLGGRNVTIHVAMRRAEAWHADWLSRWQRGCVIRPQCLQGCLHSPAALQAKRFVKAGHRVLATSRSPYEDVAQELGVGYFRDVNDFCEEHPEVGTDPSV